jgi:hypothetical protein
MSATSFARLAAVLFGLVAVAHVARLVLGAPVTIGATSVPLTVSWVGAAVTGTLCVLGFRAR